MKQIPAWAAVLALLLAACNTPRLFKKGLEHYEKRDFTAAKPIFEQYRDDARLAPAARLYLSNIRSTEQNDLGGYLAIDRDLRQADSLFRQLPPKTARRQFKQFALDTNDFAAARDLNQRKLLALVRVRNTIPALDSLLAGLPVPLPQLQEAYDATRTDIVNTHLDDGDYEVLTAIVQRHLGAVRPENYGASRRISTRLWPAFQDRYTLCELDKFAADHPQSFVARDCWREEVRQLLCRGKVTEMLDFHARNKWTALETVLLNDLADRTADFTNDSLLDPGRQAHLRDLRLRHQMLSHLRYAATAADSALILRQVQDYITRYAPRYSAFRLMEESLQFFLEKKLYHSGVELLRSARPFFPDTLPDVAGCKTNFDYQLRVKPWIDGKLPILEKPYENLSMTPLDAVNTPEGDEFSPVLSADGATLYFAASGRRDNLAGQDVFVSRLKDGRWSAPEIVAALSGDGNEVPLSLTADGRQMLLSVNGRLCISVYKQGSWGAPAPLPVTGLPLIGKGVFSPDGNMIALEGAFSAGGVLTPPDMDIFIVQREANGQWGTPVALGSDINTEGQEGNPLFGPDGRILYFTSTGFPGLGKSDVFVSYRKSDQNLANDWVRAIHLGKEVNDTYTHRGFGALSTDGKAAYFALYQRDGDKGDIWMVTLPQWQR